MALDSFFHNKIESMKLEIIQGQAVLRRLEAQRNDYNSRGIWSLRRSGVYILIAHSSSTERRVGAPTTAWFICRRSREGDGHQEGFSEGPSRREIRFVTPVQ